MYRHFNLIIKKEKLIKCSVCAEKNQKPMFRNLRIKITSTDRNIYLLVVLSFILRLIVFPFSQVNDADATTRLFIAEKWLGDPHIIYEGVWPPLHFYLNAIAIALFGERLFGPILIQMILTCLTAIPLYHFTRREFSAKGAIYTAAFYLFCPIVFHNSFNALSGLPHAFLVALALNSISKSIRKNDNRQAIYAGLYMTIAAGFRYEAWLLIAIFTGIYILFYEWKRTIYFWSASMIFPVFWMTGNYIAHQDILYGLSGAYHWNIIMEGVNDQLDTVEKVQRLIYFPISWFFLYSPFLVILVTGKTFQKIWNKDLIRSRLIWSIPFWVFFITFIYKAYEGTLLLQHRFTISLIFFSAPFISTIFEKNRWENFSKIVVGIIILSLIPLSYYWMRIPVEKHLPYSSPIRTAYKEIRTNSQNNFVAIPRLFHQNYVTFSKQINNDIREEDGLILDFVLWDNTYYLALTTNLPAEQIFIVDGSNHGQVYANYLTKFLEKYPSGKIVLRCYSKFSKMYDLKNNILTFNIGVPYSIILTPVTGESGVGVFTYGVINSSETEQLTDFSFECPEKNSLEYFIFMINYNQLLLNDIRRKARENDISVEEQIEADARWMVENIAKKDK